jgi:hypothetical protein
LANLVKLTFELERGAGLSLLDDLIKAIDPLPV